MRITSKTTDQRFWEGTNHIRTSDKFDTLSSNFHHHHNFYNLLMSSPGKNDVDRAGCCWFCVLVSPANSVPKDKYDMKKKTTTTTKMHDIFFFQFFNHFPCQFASRFYFKNIYSGKNTAIIRRPILRVTDLLVVRTSFLGPRPHLFLPAPKIPLTNLLFESLIRW